MTTRAEKGGAVIPIDIIKVIEQITNSGDYEISFAKGVYGTNVRILSPKYSISARDFDHIRELMLYAGYQMKSIEIADFDKIQMTFIKERIREGGEGDGE